MIEDVVNDGVLGPGTRYCLWVSGCNRNCKGCVSPESHDMYKGRKYSVQSLAWQIISSIKITNVEGLTISGGEPFLQAEALSQLVMMIKKHCPDIGVIVYTGYFYEQLSDLSYGKELLELCDLIIDGPYIQELDDGKALRGSSNQRVISITSRYKDYLYLYGADKRKVQLDNKNKQEIKQIGLPTDSKY